MKNELKSKLAFLDRRISEVSDPSIKSQLQHERNSLFFGTPEGLLVIQAEIGRIAQALEIGLEKYPL
jgi:hypothetical protein